MAANAMSIDKTYENPFFLMVDEPEMASISQCSVLECSPSEKPSARSDRVANSGTGKLQQFDTWQV